MELEQFCILAKSQKGRACAAVIQQVLGNKKVFVFGELLLLDSVQTLRDTEFSKHLRTLELFAYSNYSEYLTSPTLFIELSDLQVTKLKQLSIVSLAKQNKTISYATLKKELSIENIRALEDLIIETIYAGLIKGKLDQRAGLLRVKESIGRDVPPQDVQSMILKLATWRKHCTSLVQSFEDSCAYARKERNEERLLQSNMQVEVDAIKTSLKDFIVTGMDEGFGDFDRPQRQTGGGGGRTKSNRTYLTGPERSRLA